MFICKVLNLLLILRSTLSFCHLPSIQDPEVIDLGFAKHVPTWTNTTTKGTKLLNYNNIRYAQPPLGDLRFRKPKVPPPHQEGIQIGNVSSWKTDCMSSAPAGVPFPLLAGSTWGSEDCLFLNVIKPKNAKEGDKLPVLHWIVGSGYTFGGKDWTGFGLTTYGLYDRPLGLPDNFIIVTHNYRLGIPGWTPKFSEDMNGNIGVWDSLAALEWTKKYIHKFGGDADKVTVIGQSAGAAIVTYLLLAQNGSLELPFDTAWIASPTIPPRKDLERYRSVWNQVLNATGCGDLDCMRGVSEDVIRDANKYLLIDQPSGAGGGSLGPGAGFAPTVDGELLSDLPLNLFASGQFNKKIRQLVVSNTLNEGMGTSSDTDMPSRFQEIVRANIPHASDKVVQTLKSMYPYPPELPEKLAWDWTTDIIWTCTVTYIVQAYNSIARRYLFSVLPATHGLDLGYLFYSDNKTMPVPNQANIDVAHAAEGMLLQYIFRKDLPLPAGAPFVKQLSQWPDYGVREMIANITLSGFEFEAVPEFIDKRCAYINKLTQDPANGV